MCAFWWFGHYYRYFIQGTVFLSILSPACRLVPIVLLKFLLDNAPKVSLLCSNLCSVELHYAPILLLKMHIVCHIRVFGIFVNDLILGNHLKLHIRQIKLIPPAYSHTTLLLVSSVNFSLFTLGLFWGEFMVM